MPYSVLAVSLCLLAGLGVDGVRGAESPFEEPLRAELRVVQSFLTPDSPIELRFTLVNTSPEPLAIPLERPLDSGAGVSLPLELVFGTAAQPSLLITYADRQPVEVPPPDMDAPAGDREDLTPRTLLLAGHATLGTVIDLREFAHTVRYPGDYNITWQPVSGRAAPATAQFRVAPRREAIIVTDHGKLTFDLEYEDAPLNVRNFLELIEEGFYNGKIFHRIIPGFVIQGGCPRGDGTGVRPDGKLVPAEFHSAPVDVGTLLMSRKPNDPNSASCQFFIALARLEHLDEQYTVIGQAQGTESMRTLQALASVPTSESGRPLAPVTIRSVNLVDESGARVRNLGLGDSSTRSRTPRSNQQRDADTTTD